MIRVTSIAAVAVLIPLIQLLGPTSFSHQAAAETLRVPQQYESIQTALDHSKPGDEVLVSPGRYIERVALKPRVALRSVKSAQGNRAELTIIDGGGKGETPGVSLAEGSQFDGFTVTNVGIYKAAIWEKHFETNGELLGDDEGAVRSQGSIPAISVRGVNCVVTNNIVHHNGDVGIAIEGSQEGLITTLVANNQCFRNMGAGIGVAGPGEARIRGNTCKENLRAGIGCRNSNPRIIDNRCHNNIRAGIGCREGARPLIRRNNCYANRRAGIGVRMQDTAPVVEQNHCHGNEMAGIGCRDKSQPIIRSNLCETNRMAGIGCDGSTPIIVDNRCRKNLMAGIGLRSGADAILKANTCVENKLVAIGVTQGSRATIIGNRLERTGGMPPLIAVKDNSTAIIQDNQIKGGGVAAILADGNASIISNSFLGRGEKQGNAIWGWAGASLAINGNKFSGYRSAIHASKPAEILVTNNRVREFQVAAIVVSESETAPHVQRNIAYSDSPDAKVVQIKGLSGSVAENLIESAEPK